MQNDYHNNDHNFSSAGNTPATSPQETERIMENKIYTRAEMRNLDIDTSEYRFLEEIGDFYAELVLKAEARNSMLRMFFNFEDGRKTITPLFWFQRTQGLWDIPVGSRVLLHYGLSSVGKVYLTHAELINDA